MPDRLPDPLRAALLRLSRTIAANELHPQDAFEIAREIDAIADHVVECRKLYGEFTFFDWIDHG